MAKWEGWENPKHLEVPEVPKKGKSKKDTVRWCKGIEGRTHVVKRVQIVEFGEKCLKTDIYNETTSRWWRRKECGHWEHYQTKCVNCGLGRHRLRDEDLAQVDAKLAEQLELAAQWCSEGHLWDWEPFSIETLRKRAHMGAWYLRQYDIEIRNGAFMYKDHRDMWRYAHVQITQVCVMCGKKSGKRKRVTPGDLDG